MYFLKLIFNFYINFLISDLEKLQVPNFLMVFVKNLNSLNFKNVICRKINIFCQTSQQTKIIRSLFVYYVLAVPCALLHILERPRKHLQTVS